MTKHQKVAELVKQAYESSSEDFAQWMWKNHVPVVARKTEELSTRFGADADLAVAGAWLHDFGDAFMYRFAQGHEEVSQQKAKEALEQSGYSAAEVQLILEQVIQPHSCKDGELPTILEGKVLATGDALAHLTTDFYVQFAWKHLPDGKTYDQYLAWVAEKIERDFHSKIFFEEVKNEVQYRYEALKVVFTNK